MKFDIIKKRLNKRTTKKAPSYIDSYCPFSYNGTIYRTTIRTTGCSLLQQTSSRCAQCKKYRKTLSQRVLRHKKVSTRSRNSVRFVNNAALNTPQLAQRLRRLAREKKLARQKIARLQGKIRQSTEEFSVSVSPELDQKLEEIVEAKTPEIEAEFPVGSFR